MWEYRLLGGDGAIKSTPNSGVLRAGILVPMPTRIEGKWTWVVDCGANAVGKAEHLVQWGQLAHAFLLADGHADPRISILSIGSEDGKGDELTQQTSGALIKETRFAV